LRESRSACSFRAIVPLVERDELDMDAPDPAAIEDQLDVVRPPMILLLPPVLAAYDERRFESYEISLALDDDSVPGIARYETFRDLVFDPDGRWQRCVTLEAQNAACW
jgi:hypothetical protein